MKELKSKQVLPDVKDEGGVASLENFAPEAGKTLKDFKKFLKEKHGDLLTAWNKVIAPSSFMRAGPAISDRGHPGP